MQISLFSTRYHGLYHHHYDSALNTTTTIWIDHLDPLSSANSTDTLPSVPDFAHLATSRPRSVLPSISTLLTYYRGILGLLYEVSVVPRITASIIIALYLDGSLRDGFLLAGWGYHLSCFFPPPPRIRLSCQSTKQFNINHNAHARTQQPLSLVRSSPQRTCPIYPRGPIPRALLGTSRGFAGQMVVQTEIDSHRQTLAPNLSWLSFPVLSCLILDTS